MTVKTDLYNELKKNFFKEFTLGVVGLGYVGLPLVCEFIESDVSVIGFDISTEKVEKLNRGQSYIQDITDDEVSKCNSSWKIQSHNRFFRVK